MRISDWSSDVCSSDLIEEWLRSLALARPDVELRVSHNGKPSRRYKGDGQLFSGERLGETLGEEFAKHALRIEHEAAGLRLHGWIAQPVYSRASADQQYLYANGRSIRDRSVAHAVKQAYRSEEHTSELQSLMRISYAVFC